MLLIRGCALQDELFTYNSSIYVNLGCFQKVLAQQFVMQDTWRNWSKKQKSLIQSQYLHRSFQTILKRYYRKEQPEITGQLSVPREYYQQMWTYRSEIK